MSSSLPRQGAPSFGRSLRLQGDVIGALMMRELHTRFGRENLGFVWIIAEPLLFTGAVVMMWSLMRGQYDHGIPLVAFMLTGYLPLVLWRHCLSRAILCLRSNSGLLYHRQVTVLDLLASRIFLEILGCTLAYIAAAFIFFTLGFYDLPLDWGLFLLGWGFHILYSIGTALIVACVTEIYEWSEKLIGPIAYIAVPLCGFVYMVDWLPYRVQQWALFMPSVNAYEILRSGQFGPGVRVHYDLQYESFVCFGMILLGLILCRRVPHYIAIE
jgi:capsular polysaccharide transport system permease protein